MHRCLPSFSQPTHLHLLCARFLSHQTRRWSQQASETTVHVLSENSLNEVNEALAEMGINNRVKPPPEVTLQNFFKQASSVVQIVNLLKMEVWGGKLQRALKRLPVTFEPVVVTQVLRSDLPSDVAMSFFYWLKGLRRFKHDECTYGVMINNLGRTGRLDDMQKLFDEMKESGCVVTPVTISNVMLWYFRANDMEGVATHWKTMRRSGMEPSVAVYAAYIDFLFRTKDYVRVAVVFKQMIRMDCLPSSRTYSVLIQHLIGNGKVEAAANVLKAMQEMRLVPTRVAYKNVINAYAKVEDLDMVMELLKEMREHFHRPINQLMPAVKFLEATGKSKEAAILLDEIKDHPLNTIDAIQSDDDFGDVEADSECSLTEWRAVSCLHVGFDVSAFAQALHTWSRKVEVVLEQANVRWEPSLVMGIFQGLRNVDAFWAFFNWLREKVGFKHNSYSCALLIRRIFKSNSSIGRKALFVRELFERMHRDGMRFTVPMFNLVIRHYVSAGEADRALGMFEIMKQFEVEPNDITYALVIQGCAKNHHVKKVAELLAEVEGKGFPLDRSTSAALITCLGSVGKKEKAHELFCSMPTCGPLEYKAIIATYAREGDNAIALQLYDEMREAGIVPTQDVFDVVANVLEKVNKHLELRALKKQMRKLDLYNPKKKILQDRWLQILSIFMENMEPECVERALSSGSS